jgi:hypothetical protein
MVDHHLDRRQVLRAMLLGAAGLAVPVACGLPSGGHAIADGPGPPAGAGSGETLPKAPTPDDAFDPASLVTNYFAAVGGRLNVNDQDTVALAQAYFTDQEKATWQSSSSGITVVRLLNTPLRSTTGEKSNYNVDVNIQPTGQLWTDGSVKPLAQPGQGAPRWLRFSVVQAGIAPRLGYLIDQITDIETGLPVSGMMLDSEQLNGRLFLQQLIYFWSADRRGLVPDLRYVPRPAVSKEIQYTEIVNWVLNGPSDFVRGAVQGDLLKGNTIVGPNLTAPDANGLLVNLAQQLPSKITLDQLMAQLRWSLRPLYEGNVRLQINSQPQQVDGSSADNFRKANLADKYTGLYDRVYCVANGVVRSQDDAENPPAVLRTDPAVNKDVKLAALSRDLNHAALVIANPLSGQTQLLIGDGTGQGNPSYVVARLSGKVWTRPAFVPSAATRVLVAVDGNLYLVRPDGSATQLPAPNLRPVNQFAMAPDGRRIGIISGPAAYVYSLTVAGDDEIAFNSESERLINVGFAECSAIAWSLVERVLIAGTLGRTHRLAEATVDGAIVNVWSPEFDAPIQSLVTLTPSAWAPSPGLEVALIQAGPVAYVVRSSSQPDTVGFTTTTTASPSPSASGAAQAPALGTPTYPFYAG